MSKPSKKTTAPRRAKSRRKAATKPVTPKPQADEAPKSEVEELKQEIAKFDHDGDGHPGGSLPHHAEGAEAAEPPAEAEGETEEATVPSDSAWQPPEPVVETEAPAVEPEPTEPEAPVTDARSQTVSLGPVECRMRRVPLEAVRGLLSPDGLRRIEAHKSNASFESTRQRLLATDGRATPVIFAASELAAGEPTILHGFEEIAAAEESGVNDLNVILVPAGRAPDAQSHIVEMLRQQRMKGQSPDDDELFYRVHADG